MYRVKLYEVSEKKMTKIGRKPQSGEQDIITTVLIGYLSSKVANVTYIKQISLKNWDANWIDWNQKLRKFDILYLH